MVNGKKIYEKDICKIFLEKDIIVGRVIWDEYILGFCLYNKLQSCWFSFKNSSAIEVIGNIPDNPELLKGEYGI